MVQWWSGRGWVHSRCLLLVPVPPTLHLRLSERRPALPPHLRHLRWVVPCQRSRTQPARGAPRCTLARLHGGQPMARPLPGAARRAPPQGDGARPTCTHRQLGCAHWVRRRLQSGAAPQRLIKLFTHLLQAQRRCTAHLATAALRAYSTSAVRCALTTWVARVCTCLGNYDGMAASLDTTRVHTCPQSAVRMLYGSTSAAA